MGTAFERIEEFEDHFGISQLMSILKKSLSSVRRLIKKKKIFFYFTSGIYYFKKNQIKSFLEQEALWIKMKKTYLILFSFVIF